MSIANYRSDIQGLRAIAVLAVMLFHYNPAWLPGGFVGVDIFLVISGFLIVSILLKKKEQKNYLLTATLKYFYGSRLKRIVPAYLIMLVSISLLAAILFLPQDFEIYKKGLNQAFWFQSNYYFASFGDYFAPVTHEQPLLHTWSLAVEIQFYLIAPILVLLLPMRVLKWVFIGLLLGLTAWAEYRLRVLDMQQATYYSLSGRLPEFFAGGLVALYARKSDEDGEKNNCLGALGLGLILIAVIAQPYFGPFPGVQALIPVLGAILILFYPAKGVANQILANRPMVWVGELSYSLYLWHWPILALLRYYTGAQVLDIPIGLLFVALTFLVATLSFYWVEAPLRFNRSNFKKILFYGFLSIITLGATLFNDSINRALSPVPLPIKYLRYADPAIICHGKIIGDCLKGDVNSDKEVLVLGDSHGAMLNPFFDHLGNELGFKARIITASSCVSIPGFDYQRIVEWARKPCLAQIDEVEKYLPQAKIIFVSAYWSWHLKSKEFNSALIKFLEDQNKLDRKIYLFEQIPSLQKNTQRSIRFENIGLHSENEINAEHQWANNILRSYSQGYININLMNFESVNFFSKAPFFENVPIYFDGHHLNEEGAKKYAETARLVFDEIFN